MDDAVFAPFYEMLKKRGASFQFLHRLANIKLVDVDLLRKDELPYGSALEFTVQADIREGQEYWPLIDVHGVPCWPAKPGHSQLVNGGRLAAEGWGFESHWEGRKVRTKRLDVNTDFDFVVLGVGLGAIPFVCREIVERDPRWQAMVNGVKTVATQAFQIWLNQDLVTLGWSRPTTTMASFVHPFDS